MIYIDVPNRNPNTICIIPDKDVKDNIKAGNAEAPDIRKYLIK